MTYRLVPYNFCADTPVAESPPPSPSLITASGMRTPTEPHPNPLTLTLTPTPTLVTAFGMRTPTGTAIHDAEAFCLYMLDHAGLALVPGGAFGDEACVRLSYAASMETITAAMDAMESGLKALKR